MSRLLKAQTDALSAQTQATAAQHLPPLKSFSGEGGQLREMAKLAGWSTYTSAQVTVRENCSQGLSNVDRGDYERTKTALRNRFKSGVAMFGVPPQVSG